MNSSLVVPPGRIQVENGGNLTEQHATEVVDARNTRLRLGIARCTEALMDVPYYSLRLSGSGSGSDAGRQASAGSLAGGLAHQSLRYARSHFESRHSSAAEPEASRPCSVLAFRRTRRVRLFVKS
jgi:hypothetical protein